MVPDDVVEEVSSESVVLDSGDDDDEEDCRAVSIVCLELKDVKGVCSLWPLEEHGHDQDRFVC